MAKMQTTNPSDQHVADVAKQVGCSEADVRRMVANFGTPSSSYDNKK